MNNNNNDPRFQMADRELLNQAGSYACDYLDAVYGRRVYPTAEAVADLAMFEEPLPNQPTGGEEILNLLHQYGSPATVAQNAGRYFGFVNGAVYPAALAAKWLADVWDQNPALFVISPIVSKLEEICEKWLVELFGLPKTTVAGLVGGTSTATMCGLAAARLELYRRLDWNVNQKGLIGAPNIRVVTGEHAHATVFKALALLGFGRENVELVPVDDQGAIDPRKMPVLDASTLLILQAGNVNSGAFDPLQEICDQAYQSGTWTHIDGAFGLWAAASEKRKTLVAGLEKADSWSVDGHKTLNTPYDCGIVLCKHKDALVEAMQASGSYIQYGDQRDAMMYTPEMSRRSRAVDLWATLKHLGREGVEALVDGLCDNAQHLAEQLKFHGFHVLNKVVFNQVLVSCDNSDLTTAVLKQIQNSGDCWCGGSIWKQQPVIRLSVCSWKTRGSDLDKTVATFVKAREIAQQLVV